MTTAYVTLEEILQARDERRSLQQQLIHAYQKPLVSLSMNIAAPVNEPPWSTLLLMNVFFG